MKETLKYFIDALVFSIIFAILYKAEVYFKLGLKPIYVIIIALLIFVVGKMLINRIIAKSREEEVY